jgi:hypothetical protein
MELTSDHLRVAFNAWAAAQDGGGVVIEDPDFYPAAVELSEAGWLKRRFVTEPGEMSWWWTATAKAALKFNALLESADGREN